MDLSQKHSRRKILTSGLAAAAAGTLSASESKAQQSRSRIQEEWTPKKPNTTRITAITGEGDRERDGLYKITSNLPNADFWWARNTQPITPEMLSDTDLLLTYYSGYLYSEENVEMIIDNITNRGMGWLMIHNTPWFCGEKLNVFSNAFPMLHREVQPVIICDLNQEHPITKGIEPFIINLDEQFGAYIVDPDDPNYTQLFRSQGVHDQHYTIQGWCVQRGKGRIVGLTPGHYEWSWYQVQYSEIVWRAAQWALNLPIEPFYGNFDNYIW